jgi:tryptophan-rich sensory protein
LETSVHWEPLDSPYTQAKKAVKKIVVKVRAAFILLYSSWFMKPSHFRPEADSKYKNLGWGLPLIPGMTFAGGTQAFLGPGIEYHLSHLSPSIEYVIPHFLTVFWEIYFLESTLFIAASIYIGAFLGFMFHSLMCEVGKIFGMRESPPPYEFFLVRSAGGFMWFSIAIWLIALPVLAQRPDMIGRLAAGALAVPLIWMVLFLVAGLSSWMGNGYRERVHLNGMYDSDRFVKFVWRTQLTLSVLFVLTTLAGAIFLTRHPHFLLS